MLSLGLSVAVTQAGDIVMSGCWLEFKDAGGQTRLEWPDTRPGLRGQAVLQPDRQGPAKEVPPGLHGSTYLGPLPAFFLASP